MCTPFSLLAVVLTQIAQLICLYYRLCQENRVEELQQRFQALPKPFLKGCKKADDDMIDGEDNSVSYL